MGAERAYLISPCRGENKTPGCFLTWSGSSTISWVPSSSASSLPSDVALSSRASGLRVWTWSRNCIRVSSRALGVDCTAVVRERQHMSPRLGCHVLGAWAPRHILLSQAILEMSRERASRWPVAGSQACLRYEPALTQGIPQNQPVDAESPAVDGDSGERWKVRGLLTLRLLGSLKKMKFRGREDGSEV